MLINKMLIIIFYHDIKIHYYDVIFLFDVLDLNGFSGWFAKVIHFWDVFEIGRLQPRS